MDHAAIARKVRDVIFDQAEQDGRVMHGESMDRVIAEVLAKEIPGPAPAWPHAYCMATAVVRSDPTEWR